jgi:hypothetical protein
VSISPVDHDLVERYVRRFARGNMRDTIRVGRSGSAVFDEQTGTLEAAAPIVIYEGPARVYAMSGPVSYNIGDEPQHFSQAYISIPVFDDQGVAVPAPQVEDLVVIIAAPGDPEVVGRTFQVQDVEAGGQWTAVRRLQVVGVQASPQWLEATP